MKALSKTGRRILAVVLVVLTTLVLLVLLLPVILSTGWVRQRVLATVNNESPGQVKIESWRVGWLSGIELTGLRYDDAGGTLVTARSVTAPRGLITVLRTRDVGVVAVKEPFVRLATPQAGRAPAPASSGSAPLSGSASSPASRAASQATRETPSGFTGIPVTGVLRLEQARIDVGAADPAQILLKNVDATVDFSDLEQGLKWELTGTCGSTGGSLSSRGTLKLDPEAVSDPLTLPMQAELKLSSLQLEPLLALAAGFADVPSGSGLLSASLSVEGNPLRATGQVDLQALHLRGGALGDDQPFFERITLDFAGSYSSAGPVLERLTLTSPLLNATGSGTPQAMTLRAIAQVPEWFSRFPGSLHLRKGIAVQQGALDLRASLQRSDDGEAFDVSASLQELEGLLDGKRVALGEDVELTAKGVRRGEDLAMETLTVRSGFINGSASGSLEQCSASFTADIPKAMRELGTFIDLGQWRATGTGVLNADIQQKDDAQSIAARLAVSNLSVANGENVLISDPALELNLDASGDLLGSREITEMSLTCASVVLRGRLQAAGVRLPHADAPLTIADFSWISRLSMTELAPILRHTGILPEGSRLGGDVVLKTNGSGKDGRYSIPSLTLEASDFTFENSDRVIREPSVSLSASAEVDPAQRSASLASVELTLAEGTLTAPTITIADWSRAAETATARLKGDFDIAKLVQFGQPPGASTNAGPRYAGALTFDAGVDATADGLRAVVSAAAKNFEMTAPGGQKVTEDSPRLDVEMELDHAKQRLQFGKLQLATSPLSLDVSGGLTNLMTTKDLKLDGTVSTDMKQIQAYARQFTDMDFEIEGKEQKPFHLRMSLAGKTAKDMTASVLGEAGVHASRVEVFGLDLTNVDVPFVFSNSVSRMELNTDWNEGHVAIRPRVDWAQETPAIQFPENSRVIDGVRLTDALADALLAQFNPIFKGAAVAQGSVSLTLDSFYFPMSDAWQKDARFAGTLELRGVQLGATGLVHQAMQLMKARKQTADIGDRDIAIVCEDGWIRTSPLTFTIDGHPVVLAGAVGLDESLRYDIVLPLTEDLVGREVVKYLGTNTTIKLPLSGRLSRPAIDRTGLQNELVRLGTLAAQKAAARKLSDALLGKPEKTPAENQEGQPAKKKPQSLEDLLMKGLEKLDR